MNCWYCGGRVIWNCDYDAEDLGYEPGIVTHLHCSDCGAMIEMYLPNDLENN